MTDFDNLWNSVKIVKSSVKFLCRYETIGESERFSVGAALAVEIIDVASRFRCGVSTGLCVTLVVEIIVVSSTFI